MFLPSLVRQSVRRTLMKVVAVPVREDNYSYLLIDEATKKAAAIDTFDVAKVAAAADTHGVQIVANLTTHHHEDHAGGNKDFTAKYPGAPIYGGSQGVLKVSQVVKDKEEFQIGDSLHVKCLATPCHTQDSICYYITDKNKPDQPGAVFTGDTLFIGGCGRFFEGDGAEMHTALSYLGTLPDSTIVYNGHEYTGSNVAFGKHVDAENQDIDRLITLVKQNNITTGLTNIGDEKKWNVFMRLDSEPVRKVTAASGATTTSQIMDELRNLKNNFRPSASL